MRHKISNFQLLHQMLQEIPDGDRCLGWTRRKTRYGYGQIHDGTRQIGAHRVSYMLAKGPIPEGLIVCHKCDNRGCVRPDHLFLGTYLDNVRDCMAKGRFNKADQRGSKNNGGKLTEDDVKDIRKYYSLGVRAVTLGKEYGVDRCHITKIVKRDLWTHI